jgi:two-component system, sensor histidine kinase and response regulator
MPEHSSHLSQPSKKRPTLVIVDDEAMITTSLTAMLALDDLYDITTFNSPTQALDALLKGPAPDVVLSDFLMPEMTGIDFLKALRPHAPESTFIILTGYADKENAIAAINEVGIYQYLEKPWNNDALKQCIAHGLERTQLRNELRLRVEELERTQNALQDMNRELDNRVQQRTQELSEALESLKAIDRMREDFIATLTHDMRTPLLASIQTLKLMQEGRCGDLSERQQDITSMLITNQDDLLTLVNTLLDIYRYEANQQKLVFETVPLANLTQDVVNGLKPLADEREQSLQLYTMNANAESCFVKADKFALKRVLVNLISNAIRYTQTGGDIRVELQVDSVAQRLVWSVTDNGRGIPLDDQRQLFQRFAQGTSKHRVTGSGLGLYLSKKIIEAHAGDIGVESQEGQGSRFFMTLPVKS